MNISTGYKFTGKERDSESGLDEFGARYFGNNLGRFQTPDPLMAVPIISLFNRLGVAGAEQHVVDFMQRHKKLLGLE